MTTTGSALFVLAASLAAGPDSALELGVRQYNEGLLAEAVITLDGAIARLAAADAPTLLVRGYVYKGAALVGLLQEDAAKDAFAKALQIDPALRLKKGEFPDRVVRVFDAARTGKSDSVMQRPSTAPKKAGLGAVGIAAIVGGGVALAGGAVVVAGGGSDAPSSTAPATTQLPVFTVAPIAGTAFGPIQMELVSVAPPPPATLTCGVGAAGCNISVVVRLVSSIASSNIPPLDGIGFGTANQRCLITPLQETGSGRFDLRPQEPFLTSVTLSRGFAACSLPNTVTILQVTSGQPASASGQQWRVQYILNP